jgi:Leucine-rich repeat (LRR) protein
MVVTMVCACARDNLLKKIPRSVRRLRELREADLSQVRPAPTTDQNRWRDGQQRRGISVTASVLVVNTSFARRRRHLPNACFQRLCPRPLALVSVSPAASSSSQNRFKRFPAHIFGAPALRSLRLSNNKVRHVRLPLDRCGCSLPASAGGVGTHRDTITGRFGAQVRNVRLPSPQLLGTLVELHLDNNRIEELPDAFAALQSLRVLNLSANAFSEFPEVREPLFGWLVSIIEAPCSPSASDCRWC